MREMLFRQLRQLAGWPADCRWSINTSALPSPGGLQQIHASGIAGKYLLHIEFYAAYRRGPDRDQDDHSARRWRDSNRRRSKSNQANPEPGENNPRLFFIDFIRFTRIAADRRVFVQTRQQHQDRVAAIDSATARVNAFAQSASSMFAICAAPKTTKENSLPWPSSAANQDAGNAAPATVGR
ncbi:hypothetical protein ACNKHO_00375 [Shigella flexneri]